MPFWLKYKPDGTSYEVAIGPFNTRDEVAAAHTSRVNPPEGFNAPQDPGEVVEGNLSYPNTLRHPIGKVAYGGVDHAYFSDGTAEPIE